MKHKGFIYCLFALPVVLLNNSCRNVAEYNMNEYLELNNNWSFRMKDGDQWLPAVVPGCVHTDLLANNKIAQPFYRNNEKDLQWVDKNNWVYQCSFILDSQQVQHQKIILTFYGLDTYADVKLNNQHVLKAENMFRRYDIDVTGKLAAGSNMLEIEFLSPVGAGIEKLNELGYGLPAVNDLSEIGGTGDKKVSVFTRKAPYHYGWDWGPRFVTSGIWRPVKLSFVDQARIENVYYKQSLINADEAIIDATLEIDAVAEGMFRVELFSGYDNEKIASGNFELIQGSNSITLPFTISSPELWWPNGMGAQHMYKFIAQLTSGSVIIDTISHQIGLRSLELVREPDSMGKSFFFRVNGRDIFCKGANYIPNDNFLNQVTAEKYEEIISSAAEANMNMLRVWGGGIYENDIFYELCDRYGLLIWQDFMFACSMYPGDDEFLENVKEEVTDNVKRLRNHASIALWCGNNEIDAAWCEGDMNCGWSWKQRYTPEQRREIWQNYDTLFHKIIPDLIEIYDQTRAYWPSSPLADWGQTASYTAASGDMHYWGVWHANEPFSSYYKVIGRFMSEYGFQSFPDMQSIKKFTLPHDWDINSEVMMAHQRSGYGNNRIIDYMKQLYAVPDDFSEIIYVSQVMQAEAIKSAILAHRAHKPFCMGSLYWQLNDCWPVASWSGIDYYTSWKALQYYAKKAFAPVALSFFPDGDSVRIFACSDLAEDRKVKAEYSIKDFSGKVLTGKTIDFNLRNDQAVEVFFLENKWISEKFDENAVLLQVDLKEGDIVIASDIYFFGIPEKLQLKDPEISATVRKEKGEIVVDLTCKSLARNVYLWIDNCTSRFSDNYFDLLPGETKRITLPACEIDAGENNINMLTLNSLR